LPTLFRGTVVVYDTRTITYNDDHCTLATVDGRVRADYITPDKRDGTPFEEYWGMTLSPLYVTLLADRTAAPVSSVILG